MGEINDFWERLRQQVAQNAASGSSPEEQLAAISAATQGQASGPATAPALRPMDPRTLAQVPRTGDADKQKRAMAYLAKGTDPTGPEAQRKILRQHGQALQMAGVTPSPDVQRAMQPTDDEAAKSLDMGMQGTRTAGAGALRPMDPTTLAQVGGYKPTPTPAGLKLDQSLANARGMAAAPADTPVGGQVDPSVYAKYQPGGLAPVAGPAVDDPANNRNQAPKAGTAADLMMSANEGAVGDDAEAATADYQKTEDIRKSLGGGLMGMGLKGIAGGLGGSSAALDPRLATYMPLKR